MKLANLLPYFLIFLSACTCRRPDDLPKTRSVQITLNIKNDRNELLTNAKVYLFTDTKSYEFAAGNFTGKGAIDSTVSANGKATILINNNTKYYLYIMYYDEVRKLVFTNEGYSNAINELPQNIDVTVDIKLTPTSANVGFYSFNDNNFPIEFIINADTIVLSGPSSSAPLNASAPDIALKTIPKGRHKYYAKNALGCVWTGTFSVKSGEFIPIRVTGCELGDMIFWTDNSNRTRLPIAITLNGENLGSVTATVGSYACGNDGTNTLKYRRIAGAYTYVAVSADGLCAWQGQIQMRKDTCVAIRLLPCN